MQSVYESVCGRKGGGGVRIQRKNVCDIKMLPFKQQKKKQQNNTALLQRGLKTVTVAGENSHKFIFMPLALAKGFHTSPVPSKEPSRIPN